MELLTPFRRAVTSLAVLAMVFVGAGGFSVHRSPTVCEGDPCVTTIYAPIGEAFLIGAQAAAATYVLLVAISVVRTRLNDRLRGQRGPTTG